MKSPLRAILPAIILLVVTLAAGRSAGLAAPARAQGLPTLPDAPQPQRQSDGTEGVSGISFIDNPSATCSVFQKGTGICTVTWNYLNVTTDAYMVNMYITLNGKRVMQSTGFFQSSMYLPGDMLGTGFKVSCGLPNSDGLGNTYSYEVHAKDSNNLTAGNYGSVTCPGDTVNVSLPLVPRP